MDAVVSGQMVSLVSACIFTLSITQHNMKLLIEILHADVVLG